MIENELGTWGGINCSIYGTEGMMEINDNSLKYTTAKKTGWQVFKITEKNHVGYGDAFVRQAYSICEWLEGKIDDYRGEAKQGRAALEIMMGVYESARMRERVKLPLQTRANPLDVAVESGQWPVERPGRWDERSFLVRGEDMTWIK